jgi:hypothetical protein
MATLQEEQTAFSKTPQARSMGVGTPGDITRSKLTTMEATGIKSISINQKQPMGSKWSLAAQRESRCKVGPHKQCRARVLGVDIVTQDINSLLARETDIRVREDGLVLTSRRSAASSSTRIRTAPMEIAAPTHMALTS